MPASPSRDLTLLQLDHIAELASLLLARAEAEALAIELNRILGYVAELDEVDTSGVSPTSTVQQGPTSLRVDEVTPGISHDEALSQAPRVAGGGFAVPAFLDVHGAGVRR